MIGFLGLFAAQSYLATLVEQAGTAPEAAIERFRTFVTRFSVLCSFGVLAVAVWLRSIARQALDEERFPPSTVRVLRPTPVSTGEAARVWAAITLICSFILILSALALPVSLLSLLEVIESSVR